MSKENNITSEEVMMERGKFAANGFTFFIRPVYFEEIEEYLLEMELPLVPSTKEDIEELQTDEKKMGHWAIALFSAELNEKEKENKPKKRGLLYKLKRIFETVFYRNDYRYYKAYPKMVNSIKWIERKVFYNGKPIRFYDLERKFNLSKADIERMFIYLHDISGF